MSEESKLLADIDAIISLWNKDTPKHIMDSQALTIQKMLQNHKEIANISSCAFNIIDGLIQQNYGQIIKQNNLSGALHYFTRGTILVSIQNTYFIFNTYELYLHFELFLEAAILKLTLSTSNIKSMLSTYFILPICINNSVLICNSTNTEEITHISQRMSNYTLQLINITSSENINNGQEMLKKDTTTIKKNKQSKINEVKNKAIEWINANKPTKKHTPTKYHNKYMNAQTTKHRLQMKEFNELMRKLGYQIAKSNTSYWKYVGISDSNSDSDGDTDNCISNDNKPDILSDNDEDVTFKKRDRKQGKIYLVQTKSMNKHVYKIGKSDVNNNSRIKSYGNKASIHRHITVNVPTKCEDEIIKQFTKKFGDPVQGREYFKCKNNDIFLLFDDIVSKYKVEDDDSGNDSDTD